MLYRDGLGGLGTLRLPPPGDDSTYMKHLSQTDRDRGKAEVAGNWGEGWGARASVYWGRAPVCEDKEALEMNDGDVRSQSEKPTERQILYEMTCVCDLKNTTGE